ncbi:MAG: dimethylsulfoniopropionate demethylase [Candidatus Marinimicrobia bacterium]|nr:dimethylsulfoniopropionate demethylase [Candidatus Neomarinimicrobiota bacterium]|tara:strand:+ start:7733 stop:8839 length:1107 start_codon:yes stop_codon:yes gene_type:complete
MKAIITRSRRLRGTPFTSRIEKQGVKSYTVYNHMLLPTTFSTPEDEYIHLKKHVQIWDVSVQREIEISGSDSSKLVQLMTCRNLSKSKIGLCYYAPLVDSNGGLINDPLIYKLEDNKWRICIADSDVLLYAKGIADAKNLKVKIFEAAIDTIAVQGPKSFKLMESVFGEKIKNLKFFHFDFFEFNKNKFLISRSGFSKQGGYEIHIENTEAGLKLYDHFFKIGKEFNLKPGTPNHPERIEGGLLSYGSDIDINDNPLECGFDRYVDLESDIFFLGKDKLKKIRDTGIKKKLMGVKIDTNYINVSNEIPIYNTNEKVIGQLRSGAFSPKFNKVVGIGMFKNEFSNSSQTFKIKLNGKFINGEVCNLPIK